MQIVRAQVQQLQLLTAKPMLYVCNVDDASLSIDGGNDLERRVKEEVAKVMWFVDYM